MPVANVFVAIPPVWLRYCKATPPAKVDVELTPLTLMNPAKVEVALRPLTLMRLEKVVEPETVLTVRTDEVAAFKILNAV